MECLDTRGDFPALCREAAHYRSRLSLSTSRHAILCEPSWRVRCSSMASFPLIGVRALAQSTSGKRPLSPLCAHLQHSARNSAGTSATDGKHFCAMSKAVLKRISEKVLSAEWCWFEVGIFAYFGMQFPM